MADPTDSGTRELALDPSRSFIVQAPAGSGKTELLIQRHLKLLAGVAEPEQVIAITFTRKAAAEMRARLLRMLRAAEQPEPDVEPHQIATLDLARRVIDRDRRLGWSLIEQPHRLRIDTVDALNAWLADRLPILSGGVSGAEIAEDPSALYTLAAQRMVERCLGDAGLEPMLRRLLEAADGSIERLERMLAAVLPMRDQWSGLLGWNDADAFRIGVESALAAMASTRIRRIRTRLGPGLCERITSLLRQADEETGTVSDTSAPAHGTVSVDGPPDAQLELWRAAARLFLTRTGGWRTRFGRREGFPADAVAARAELDEIRRQLQSEDGLEAELAAMQDFPDLVLGPERSADGAAVRQVLRQLLAELNVIFQQSRRVDFLELALAAQRALGRVDSPSEMLLALDNRIEHILVDEFQDTSQSQFRLLELLTAGWTPGDGRTLFLVGDPMQSIYRFRDADMSLFLRVKRNGIGAVACESLVLTDNFRCAPAVVDWVNGVFEREFPAEDRIETGLARYAPFHARRSPQSDQRVRLYGITSGDLAAEQARVVDIAERELALDPEQSVAILVRSRTHLAGLQDRLRARGLPTQAIETDELGRQPEVQPVVALTRALLHFGDRIAWLALLRAPWCGLTWVDLDALCGDDHRSTIWALIHDADRLAQLSVDGRQRLDHLKDRLEQASESRGDRALSRWIEQSWRLLDGPACVTNTGQLDAVYQFFRLLDNLGDCGDLDDPAALVDRLSRRIGQQPVPAPGSVEIMTIHKAKGLEFDTVILFGLHRQIRGPDPKVLHWYSEPVDSGDAVLVAAPATAGHDRLTDYLKALDRQMDVAERARLLYVAVTRARERLHLVSHVDDQTREPPKGSLLSLLGPEFGSAERSRPDIETRAGASFELPLRRLRELRSVSAPAIAATGADLRNERERPEYQWATPAAMHAGTVVHRELQRQSRVGFDSATSEDPQRHAGRFRRELELLGVTEADLNTTVERVCLTLRTVYGDETGRWILAPHAEAESELRLTVADDTGFTHLQLDRTFVTDDGTRWIIDYKTSTHRGGDIETFLANEVERYRDQLESYARAIATIDDRPIRVGLYFPLLGEFRDWAPSARGEPATANRRT